MAQLGLKYLAWAQIDQETDNAEPSYKEGKEIGKIVSLNATVSNSEGKLYANDQLVEYAGEFTEGDLTIAVDNIDLADQAKMLGATYSEETEEVSGINDTAPYGGIGGYQVLMVKGKRKFRAWVFPKVKAQQPDMDAATKGDSISFGTEPIKAKITATNKGSWRFRKEFDKEEDAKAYVDTKLGIATAQANTTGE